MIDDYEHILSTINNIDTLYTNNKITNFIDKILDFKNY